MGYAGNTDPQFIIPTAIATKDERTIRGPKRGVEDLDFHIGDEAIANQKTYGVSYPVRHGQIDDWDQMERYWEQSIFKYLRCEPEDHHFLLVYTCARIFLRDGFNTSCRLSPLLIRRKIVNSLPKSCLKASTYQAYTSQCKPSWLWPPLGLLTRSPSARLRVPLSTLATE